VLRPFLQTPVFVAPFIFLNPCLVPSFCYLIIVTSLLLPHFPPAGAYETPASRLQNTGPTNCYILESQTRVRSQRQMEEVCSGQALKLRVSMALIFAESLVITHQFVRSR
jgi:hypothetical protein